VFLNIDECEDVNCIRRVNVIPICESNVPLMTTNLTGSLMHYYVNFPYGSLVSHSPIM